MTGQRWHEGQAVTIIGAMGSMRLSTIEKITHKGKQIRVAGNVTPFDGEGRTKSRSQRIVPTTPEHVATIERKALDDRLDELLGVHDGFVGRTSKRAALSTETVRGVIALIEGQAKKPGAA